MTVVIGVWWRGCINWTTIILATANHTRVVRVRRSALVGFFGSNKSLILISEYFCEEDWKKIEFNDEFYEIFFDSSFSLKINVKCIEYTVFSEINALSA